MSLDRLFKAFSDPNRIAIIKHISAGECCSCQMQDTFSISQPTLSYHLNLISGTGLTSVKKVGTWNKYRLNNDKIDEMIAFLNSLKTEGDCQCL